MIKTEKPAVSVKHVCRYRADLPCDHPMLKCKSCPRYIRDMQQALYKTSEYDRLVSLLPNPCPYISIGTRREKPIVEIGIKGTF